MSKFEQFWAVLEPSERKVIKLTGKQTAALTALLSGSTKGEAAAAAGVAPSSLRRWLADDTAFKAAYRQGLDELLQDAATKARAAAGLAVDVLAVSAGAIL